MRVTQLFENTDNILQPISLSPRELQQFNRAVDEWLATRPWSNDLNELNQMVDFFNRASSVRNTPAILPRILDFIRSHPGRDAP